MWRLVVSELAGKSMYKGQKLVFLNSIRAQVKSIYRQGSKITSGFFESGTKPIFRSESSRYVILIQMSREMWDFEAEGSGEIMFHKVVNGFLPELFGRWRDIGVSHLVSIILFTRMEYEEHSAPKSYADGTDTNFNSYTGNGRSPYRDFYHVLASDMISGQWSAILTQLKKQFKTFLRDVSIRLGAVTEQPFITRDGLAAFEPGPLGTIEGHPALAAKGNILEAIHTAFSQFPEDHIDCDLIHTGLSIVVVTPGTGVFEVEADLLSLTTDALIENGVSIDLVCLARMPLHSVPLFVYRSRRTGDHMAHESERHVPRIQANMEGESKDAASGIRGIKNKYEIVSCDVSGYYMNATNQWSYAIPHWVDVSFWTSHKLPAQIENSSVKNFGSSRVRRFLPRVKMYEIQMMGIMENDASSIAIPCLENVGELISTKGSSRQQQELRSQGSFSSLVTSFQRGESLGTKLLDSSSFSPKSPSYMSNVKSLNPLMQWMEKHDDGLFVQSNRQDMIPEQLLSYQGTSLSLESNEMKGLHSLATRKAQAQKAKPGSRQTLAGGSSGVPQNPRGVARKSSGVSTTSRATSNITRPSKGDRQVSLGFRGFGNTMLKATPVIEISSEVAHRESLLTRGLKTLPSQIRPAAVRAISSINFEQESSKEPKLLVDRSSRSREAEPIAKPIDIRHASSEKSGKTRYGEESSPTRALQEGLSHESKEPEIDISKSRPFSPITQALAPWFTVLNPSNPSLTSVKPSSRLGRWHHVIPRPLHASTIKWKSLCSPASIPLTTEGFPSSTLLKTEYGVKEYKVNAIGNEVAQDQNSREWLMKELVCARLSHGFQIIVGSFISSELGAVHLGQLDIFDEEQICPQGTLIYMSRGSQIHELKVSGENSIELKQYVQRPQYSQEQKKSYSYRPAVKTTLSKEYSSRTIQMSTSRESYDWQQLDTFIAGHEKNLKIHYPDLRGFRRARYVLIPAEVPSTSKRVPPNSTEDNEEEVRLEGIYKLTQMWQRNRYTPGDLQPRKIKPRVENTNPLDIMFRTQSPSEIVASELHESLLEKTPNDRITTDLLPESELLDRSDINLPTLAQLLQGERGINLQDRRWHLRLHYNCFIGIEFVTWLVQNFRDVQSRDEATELGNELMREGLFAHVERRHNFRDGNFFYQISPGYRAPRAETRSWFQKLASIPSTPISETRYSPGQSQSSDDEASDDGSTTPTEKLRRTKVTLSKQLVYDVDRRKKSHRRELINLHYDRISSADDCYHVRIDWLNVTPKLIQDAVVSWASVVERHGLRLIELPISEASKVDEHMFMSPYIVKLARSPPESPPKGTFGATSFTPKSAGSYPYQKALLRKFNFVLDLEAATDFPTSVDVFYSWGKPDYQYPQFISRDGVMLAQVTDDGNLLLLPNRLYNDKGTTGSSYNRGTGQASEHALGNARRSPARLPVTVRLSSPRGSPYASPLVRATLDTGSRQAKAETISSVRIKEELETFCSNPEALEKFYDEVLHSRNALTVPTTPEFTSLVGENVGLPTVPNLKEEPLFLTKTTS